MNVNGFKFFDYDYPLTVSIKAALLQQGQAVLLKNPRGEWELPGGKLEPGELPIETLERELLEELGWTVEVGPLLDAWVYEISQDRHVFVVTYGCVFDSDRPATLTEHKEMCLSWPAKLAELNMPEAYKRSLLDWEARLRAGI